MLFKKNEKCSTLTLEELKGRKIMNKFIEKINKKENTIMVICILIIFACIIFFFVTYSKEINENAFVYSDNLNEQVFSISSGDNETMNVKLKDFSYYVIVSESNTQTQAFFLNEDDAVNFWRLKTSPVKNVHSEVKDLCIETCIKDYILYMEALKNNISLTDEEEDYLADISYEIYSSLTGEQVNITEIELEDIVNAQRKIFLAEKYILSMVDNDTISARTELSCKGTYYLEEIKPQYKVKKNDDMLNELLFGTITVNTHLKED